MTGTYYVHCTYSTAVQCTVEGTDYIYMGDGKKKSRRLPPVPLLSPDSRKYLCGSKQSFEEGGGGIQGVNECQLFVVYSTHNLHK